MIFNRREKVLRTIRVIFFTLLFANFINMTIWARWSIWGLSVVCDVVGALSLAKHMTTYSLKGALHKIVPAAYKTASKLNDVCKALDWVLCGVETAVSIFRRG